MSRIKGLAMLTGIALATALCQACGTYGTAPNQNVQVQGVKLAPQSVQLAIGETKRLTATVEPAYATDQTITWESTNPGVVSVDATGLLTAKAPGAGVLITVFTRDGHHEASTTVTVNP